MSSTSTDYYKSLGLEKDSTVAQIKCAYRRLVLIYHPDKNGGSVRAEEKFKLVRSPTLPSPASIK
jgi:curved DNA-binding protein CbpA